MGAYSGLRGRRIFRRRFSEAAMLLDVFYLAIGVLSVVLCWSFVKACDRL
ncbi:MAG: hypothetical protein ABI634_13825 [Acidobacteriota bacterium]